MSNRNDGFALCVVASVVALILPMRSFAILGCSEPASRMNASRIQVGMTAFRGDMASDRLVRATKEAGIDFVVSYENLGGRAALDCLQRHGLGCLLGGAVPRWWGGSGRNGKMAETFPLEAFEKAAKGFADHPAVWGIPIGDEPSALDMPHVGAVARTVARAFPAQFPFICLFPIYALPSGTAQRTAAESMLGVPTYDAYVAAACRELPMDFLMTDIYPWGWSVRRSQFVENIRVISDAALGTGRRWGVVLQQNQCVSGPYTNRTMTANTMRYQAFSAMAYGAEVFMWACWAPIWWKDNFIEGGEVNPRAFARLKTVNDELHAFSPHYMRFRRVTTDLVGIDRKAFDPRGEIRQAVLPYGNGSVFHEVHTADESALAVGHMVARDGSGASAMFVAAIDDPEGENGREHELLFRAARTPTLVIGNDGLRMLPSGDGGTYRVPIRSNQAVLVIAE